MYRVSPGTYLVSGIVSTALARNDVVCTTNELLRLSPPANSTCGAYLGPFAEAAQGSLLNPDATDECLYCPISSTDQFLARFDIDYADRWWNFGVLWVYIVVNVAMAMGLYWAFRVPKKSKALKRA